MKPEQRSELRRDLYDRIDKADIGLVEAVRIMRRITDKTQVEYARMVGVSPRILKEFERGVGNPGLKTLERILAPFNLELTVRRRRPSAGTLERLVLFEIAHRWSHAPAGPVLPIDVAAGTPKADGTPMTEDDVRRVVPALVKSGLVTQRADGSIALTA
jgi:transcriptional regulator with XRE-family HTH domain